MTKQEINEYIAEHIFGLKQGVDFGQLGKHDYVEGATLYGKNTEFKCRKCGDMASFENYEEDIGEELGLCVVPCPDYCEDYRPVLEWIAREVDDVIIYQNAKSGFVCTFTNWVDQMGMDYPAKTFEGIGDTIGEAICRVAVEYCKTRIEKNNPNETAIKMALTSCRIKTLIEEYENEYTNTQNETGLG